MEDKQAVQTSVWSPLLIPVFRALWVACVVANLGVWMQNVSGVWLMTTLASSPVLIALMQTAISFPIFLLGLPSGTLADIVNRRTLLIVGLSIMLLAASILGTVTLLGVATPWLLLLLTFGLNLGIALNLPIWLAVMPGLVPRKELSNAVSLGGVGFNLAQALGPVLGGVIVAVIGPGAVFLLNAVLFLLTLFILIRWHNPQPSSALPAERFISAMSAALRYLGHAPPLQRVLLRSTVFMSCASALLALLPLVAKHDLNMGGLGYGLLQGCLGLGAVIGAIAMPRLRYRFSIDVLIVGATVVYAIMVVAVATLHLVILLFVLLLITGVAWMAFLSSANIATLQAVPKWVQARALGLYLLFLQGGTAAGSVIWGWVAARWGRWDKWSRGIMMKIIVIGGGGHIGSYLVPKLVKAGHKVVSISRGQSKPYTEDPAWRHVEQMILDRDKESGGEFERKIAALNADVVVDLINFLLENTKYMAEALKNTNLSHYLFCSSLWAHGKATTLPVIEDQPKFPLDEYGRQKAKSEAYLHSLYRQECFPETVIMPGQISGPGWVIINPTANHDYWIFNKIRRGEEIALPNFGMETLHHVHADDVAQVFFHAITHRKSALGESFHAVEAESITLLGYAQAMYRWFGQEEKIKLLPWNEWCTYTKDKEYIDSTYYHIVRSGYYSIEKGKRLLEYYPRHTLLETVEESVAYMVEHQWFEKQK